MDVGQLSSGTIRVLVGAGLILLGVVAMGSHSALLGLALFIGGVLVIWSVLDAGKQKEVLRAYQAMVQGGEPLHLAQLAQSLGMEQEEAKRCLIELSRRKQIPPLKFTDHIERSEQPSFRAQAASSPRTNGSHSATQASKPEPVYTASNVQPIMITVCCRSCGATTQIRRGEVAECEHCGNPLAS